MTSEDSVSLGSAAFETLKRINGHGAEFWSARDLQPLLGYSQWRRFAEAVERARQSCQASGNEPDYHFAGAGKPIPGGKGAIQIVDDFHLSRFACYLIAQNGDSRKPAIAKAQEYFAIQTRRQEMSGQLAQDAERIEMRKQAGEEFKALSGAARQAGVQDRMFGVFHDAGYKGLYGGLGAAAIKKKKTVPDAHNLMDRMNATELAANQFRMTQTRDKLAREKIRGEQNAISTHQSVGREVREAIKKIGGVLPEDIPPDEHILEVKKRVEKAPSKLTLDKRDAGGLMGSPDES